MSPACREWHREKFSVNPAGSNQPIAQKVRKENPWPGPVHPAKSIPKVPAGQSEFRLRRAGQNKKINFNQAKKVRRQFPAAFPGMYDR